MVDREVGGGEVTHFVSSLRDEVKCLLRTSTTPGAILGAVVMWERSCPSFHGAGILEGADSEQLVTNEDEKTLVAGERGDTSILRSLGSGEISSGHAHKQ